MREHRYRFQLFSNLPADSDAITMLKNYEAQNPVRASEIVRRLILQGYAFSSMLSRIDKQIIDIEHSTTNGAGFGTGSTFLLRLSGGDIKADTGVWNDLIKEANQRSRSRKLRRLFLYGYWLETATDRPMKNITDVLSFRELNEPPAVERAGVNFKAKAKSSLGNLMP